MKITIFGAGAVGGHLAARLGAGAARAGLEVAAVARGTQLAAMAERGLELQIGDERYAARIRATDRPQELGPQDVVIVTLKSSVLPHAAPQLQPLLGPDTTVIFAMNGIPFWYLHRLDDNGLPRPDLSRLDPGGALAGTVGLERVVGCVINSMNEVVAPGVIRNPAGAVNRFTLGEPDGSVSRRVTAIAAILEKAGLNVPVTRTIRADIWDKLLRNLSTSPICSMTGEPIGVLSRHPELFDLAKGLAAEGLAVARAHRVPTDLTLERLYPAAPTTGHKSSMLQDFERQRPPEIDGLLTSVQAFARAAEVPTPRVDAITALVVEKARRLGLYPAAA